MVKLHEMKLLLIKEQLQEATDTDKDAMSSTLIVEGEIMSFEIEELKIRLREREIEVRLSTFDSGETHQYFERRVMPR